MIVFAFYGCGKSTYCKNNPNCADLDFELFQYEDGLYDENGDYLSGHALEDAYINTALRLEKEYDIVFVNRLFEEMPVDLAFIQDNYNDCVKVCGSRREHPFVPAGGEYGYALGELKYHNKTKTIFLCKDEFISDYETVLESMLNDRDDLEGIDEDLFR